MDKIKTIIMPEEIKYIIEIFKKNNYQAFIVGGCVRDSIMCRTPKDWDISTDAPPYDTKRLFSKTIDTGLKHNTVTVVLNKKNFEITTFRSKPSNSIPNIEDDLALRDFTINAIAYNPESGFIDPFSGIKDIEHSIIRAVENSNDRFREDPLRMIRAIRFSSTLNFGVDFSTLKAIEENNSLINNVSPERIRDELTKILVSHQPMKFTLLRETGLLKHILPEFDICFETSQNHPFHIYNVALHSLVAVSEIENNSVLRWTMLLHDTGKALTKTTDDKGIDHFYGHPEKSVYIAKNVLQRLKFDNKTIDKVCTLVKHHDRRIEPAYKYVRRAMNIVGEELFLDLIKVKKADKKGQGTLHLNERLSNLDILKEMYCEIKENDQCVTLKSLAINGNDLKNLGFDESREIGFILKKLLNAVIDNPELNSKENLIGLVNERKIYK
jgi:tRNA nucleotidyltransferase (CCA-adding enzyme)